MTVAVLDPAAAIAAAHQELRDQLRDLVDGCPADELLDRVRQLTQRVGRKISRARKAAKPEPAVAPQPTTPPEDRADATPASAPTRLVATDLARTASDVPASSRAVPAAKVSPAATVRVPDQPAAQPAEERPPAKRGGVLGRIRRRIRRMIGVLVDAVVTVGVHLGIVRMDRSRTTSAGR